MTRSGRGDAMLAKDYVSLADSQLPNSGCACKDVFLKIKKHSPFQATATSLEIKLIFIQYTWSCPFVVEELILRAALTYQIFLIKIKLIEKAKYFQSYCKNLIRDQGKGN